MRTVLQRFEKPGIFGSWTPENMAILLRVRNFPELSLPQIGTCLANSRYVENKSSKFLPVAQEHPLGCAAACIASLAGLNYQQALGMFENPALAWIRGFYCNEVIQALNKMGFQYLFDEFDFSKHSELLKKEGSIVFVAPCQSYPAGHFLLRLKDGWMNPWANFPQMNNVQASVEKILPGEISYIIYKDESWL
jgi:hypothetical protein